ncbi:MAG: hypothetical protein D6734_02490 [Candidatus Schekmanbacteria bacterium]|nr:MAG: hypothetical protein D6734_02490 [Candidatus Schekmanbacteria bacterium]
MGKNMEPDPVGQISDVNLYPYVGNNPVNQIDALGLFWRIPMGVSYSGEANKSYRRVIYFFGKEDIN